MFVFDNSCGFLLFILFHLLWLLNSIVAKWLHQDFPLANNAIFFCFVTMSRRYGKGYNSTNNTVPPMHTLNSIFNSGIFPKNCRKCLTCMSKICIISMEHFCCHFLRADSISIKITKCFLLFDAMMNKGHFT